MIKIQNTFTANPIFFPKITSGTFEKPIFYQASVNSPKEILFIEIESCTIYKGTTEDGFTRHQVNKNDRIGSIATVTDKNNRTKIIANLQSGIFFLDENFKPTEFIAHPEEDRKGVRYNDCSITPKGDLIVGSMYAEKELRVKNPGAGKIWLMNISSGKYSEIKVKDSLTTPNGFAWKKITEDKYFCYYADTPSRSIKVLEYQINKNLFNDLGEVYNFKDLYPDSNARPDGMCFTASGDLFVASFEGGAVESFEIDTKNNFVPKTRIQVDNPLTTCPLVDDETNTIYITTGVKSIEDSGLFCG